MITCSNLYRAPKTRANLPFLFAFSEQVKVKVKESSQHGYVAFSREAKAM